MKAICEQSDYTKKVEDRREAEREVGERRGCNVVRELVAGELVDRSSSKTHGECPMALASIL